MLYLVLLLVVGSLGLLIGALRTGDTVWAWASVGVSVIAALLLLFDLAGRRLAAEEERKATAASPSTSSDDDSDSVEPTTSGAVGDDSGPDDQRVRVEQQAVAESAGRREPAADVTAASSLDGGTHTGAGPNGEIRPGRHLASGDAAAAQAYPLRPGYRTPSRVAPAAAPGVAPISLDPTVEPPEEDTDAGDALRIAEMSDEVRVLDERPRYHVAGCAWVGGRSSLPLPVNEARELGFSPCALCRPDAMLCHRRRSSAN